MAKLSPGILAQSLLLKKTLTQVALTQLSCVNDGHLPSRHWSQDEVGAILQTPIQNAFSWMQICCFRLKFHLPSII